MFRFMRWGSTVSCDKMLSVKDSLFLKSGNRIRIKMCAGLYSKHVPIVPVLVESWSGQVNSGPW